MAIFIYSQMAYQKALPPPRPQDDPEYSMGMQFGKPADESVSLMPQDQATPVATAPAAPTAPVTPPPVLKPEPTVIQSPASMAPQVPAPAPVAPEAPVAPPQPQLPVGDLLKHSKNPFDNLSWEFQQEHQKLLQTMPKKAWDKHVRENVTHRLPLNETQHHILEKALAHPMTNPDDGTPMTYRAKLRDGTVVEKPLTLEKYVQRTLRDAGLEPDMAFQYISDSLRGAKTNFMSALKSKIFYAKKGPEGGGNGGWQGARAKRSLSKFKDYFDPKNEELFVPSGDTMDIAEKFEAHTYGPVEVRKQKAEAWTDMYNKLSKMTDFKAPMKKDKVTGELVPLFDEKYPFKVRIDSRTPREREEKKGEPFKIKQAALDSLVVARKLFTQFAAQHPDMAKKLGLNEFLSPNGKNYLSKAMVYPAEDNIRADIETARKGLGAKSAPAPSFRTRKQDGEDHDNQGFTDLDNGTGGGDDDDDTRAAISKRTVVAAIGETIYDDEESNALLKVAMLLSSLRIPTSDAITSANLDTMMSWLDENSELFATDSVATCEQKFAMAVKRVLNDCIETLDGEPAFEKQRQEMRTAAFILASRIVRG